jgi:hypothetical protein
VLTSAGAASPWLQVDESSPTLQHNDSALRCGFEAYRQFRKGLPSGEDQTYQGKFFTPFYSPSPHYTVVPLVTAALGCSSTAYLLQYARTALENTAPLSRWIRGERM